MSDSANKPLPQTIRLLKWGVNPSTKGPIKITAVTRDCLAKNQRQMGHETIAIDFEHNTVPGTPEFQRTSEPRSVAGYGKPRLDPANGLELCDIQWTPTGERTAGDYKDLSPAVSLTEEGDVYFIHSVALCRNGAVHGLELSKAQRLDE